LAASIPAILIGFARARPGIQAVVRGGPLDHVALWVADRAALRDFVCPALGMHVIEETDKFTLVGADALRGKLTLFDAEGPRDPGVLGHVALRVGDLDRAIESLPGETPIDREDGAAYFDAPGGLRLGLVESEGADYDLDHVALRVSDVEAVAEDLSGLGFERRDGQLWAGEAYLRIDGADGAGETDRPLLNHLALLVDSADEHLEEARDRQLDVADVVDAENTYAVFVNGPEGIKVEYVEHKETFSLR
jgi:catechol 2,3-dioxygenase-like lactoylglutathione lyase family enzyme